MHVCSVVGARPQFVKLAPVATALAHHDIDHVIVHTGQHYDPNMSAVFFDDLKIPTADHNLEVGSHSHGAQTGAMLVELERVLDDLRPDWVLTYGDTNSTLAAAIAAVKLHLRTAHLEAGLRSFNRRMPEEHNRVLTDHASDLLLAPSRVAVGNLAVEGLEHRTVHVGDVMVDVAAKVRESVLNDPPPLPVGPDEDYVLATIHRAENTDDAARLKAIIDALGHVAGTVLLPAHPRLVARARTFGLALETGAIRVVEPLPYRTLIHAIMQARGVVTDSGGLQKEAYVLGVPCTTVRSETEWTETLGGGWNVLVDVAQIADMASRQTPTDPPSDAPYGNGQAAFRVVEALQEGLGYDSRAPR